MKRYSLLSLLLGLAILLTGCAAPVHEFGHDFGTVPVSGLALGKATRADMTQLLGKPERETAETYKKDTLGKELDSPLIMYTAEYWFGSNDPTKPSVQTGVSARRHLSVFLVGDTVAGYRLNSSFKGDSTAFDMSKVNSVKKGESTEADVLALLGKPSGMAVYPLAAEPGGTIYFYTDGHIDHMTNKDEWKATVVQFGADHRVNVISATQESKARPIVRAPTPVFIPIYIPARR